VCARVCVNIIIIIIIKFSIVCGRSVRVIQAWWRWSLLHHRLNILKETKLRAESIDASTLYIVTSGLRRRLKEIDAAPRLLRESRIPFDVSHRGERGERPIPL
jgi:hypothetical protein